MNRMYCPDKKKWVITNNDAIACYEPKIAECERCQFNKKVGNLK